MASSADILLGGTDGDTSGSPPPPSSADILLGPQTGEAQPSPAAAKPGDIDPITGRPYAFMSTGGTDPVAASTGRPVAEPTPSQAGFGLPMKLATSDDPEQRRRIAAKALYPDLSPNEAASRVFYGDNGRLATVDAKGNPYFIDPMPLFAGSDPYSPSSLVTPYGPGSFTSPNLAAHEAATVPDLVKTAVVGGAQYGGPVAAGAGSAAADIARYWAARQFDPDPSKAPGLDWGSVGTNALMTTLGLLPKIIARPAVPPTGSPFAAAPGPRVTTPPPTAPTIFGRNEPPPLSPQFSNYPYAPGYSPTVTAVGPTSDNPLVLPQSQRGPNALMPSGAPVTPAAAAPGATAAHGPAVQLNPAGDAAPPTGPYAASSPVEVATIPDALPTIRTPIFTQAQADARADQIIQHFAANGPKDADTSVNIPGSVPTLAQSTGNAGLATLERGMRNNPDAVNIFNSVDTAQQQAQQAALKRLVGTPDDLAAAEAQRAASTSALRDKAFAPGNVSPTDASDAVAEIDKVLTGPGGGRTAVTGPLANLRKGFFNADGTPITDPETLYNSTRKNITDALSPLARGTAADAQAASVELQRVLPKLDAAIEAGAPGYQNYMNAFRDQSGPVNAMQYLQSRNLTDASGNTTLQKLDSTIKDVQRQQAMPGARKADSLSDDQMAQLEALRTDALRSANLAKGKALGSNTVQNLATNTTSNMLINPAANIAGRVVGGVFGGFPGYIAAETTGAGLSAMQTASERRVRQAVIDRLLNKNGLGEAALQGTPPP